MTKANLGRRALLARWATVAGSVATVGLAARPAGAFRIEQVPATADLAQLYGRRCGQPVEHEALIRDMRARLAKRAASGTSSETETMTCPLCGCRVVATTEDSQAPIEH
jgi:hypothetical protein